MDPTTWYCFHKFYGMLHYSRSVCQENMQKGHRVRSKHSPFSNVHNREGDSRILRHCNARTLCAKSRNCKWELNLSFQVTHEAQSYVNLNTNSEGMQPSIHGIDELWMKWVLCTCSKPRTETRGLHTNTINASWKWHWMTLDELTPTSLNDSFLLLQGSL